MPEPEAHHHVGIGPDESLYRRLIDLAPDAMVCVDGRGTIVLVNSQAEVLFGYERSELLGRAVELLVPEAARGVHPDHRAAYLGHPTPRPMGLGVALAARRRDGTEFPAEISLAAVDTGSVRIVSASIRDMTERLAAEREREQLAIEAELERTERQMLQSQRLESLGQLAGGVAHDFNNVLAVISNYAAFVREEIDAEAERSGDDRWRTARRDIGHIEQAAATAARLTRQLLTFARREVVHAQPLDINAVVAETVGLLERTLGEDVRLDVRLADQLEPVLGDLGQLQQLLMNVAINARHAMPSGGTLTIATSRHHSERDGGSEPRVRLAVADTGIGMPRDVLLRAFEPFFTTGKEGTGLGLATVYGIVAQMGGDAWLRSEPGAGTVFTAEFPSTAVAPSAEPAAEPAVSRGPGTVLVVDDEAGIRDVAERILVRHGFDVLVAGDADEACALAERFPGTLDLVLSDVIMPGCNGPELLDRLREIRPGVAVLFMSGYTGTELASRASMGESFELLEKPFSERQLIDAVTDLLVR